MKFRTGLSFGHIHVHASLVLCGHDGATETRGPRRSPDPHVSGRFHSAHQAAPPPAGPLPPRALAPVRLPLAFRRHLSLPLGASQFAASWPPRREQSPGASNPSPGRRPPETPSLRLPTRDSTRRPRPREASPCEFGGRRRPLRTLLPSALLLLRRLPQAAVPRSGEAASRVPAPAPRTARPRGRGCPRRPRPCPPLAPGDPARRQPNHRTPRSSPPGRPGSQAPGALHSGRPPSGSSRQASERGFFGSAPAGLHIRGQKIGNLEMHFSRDELIGSAFIAFGITLFVCFFYVAIVSKLLAPYENRFLAAIQNDWYYCLLVPLTLPVIIVAVYLHWLSMKMFKHA